MTKMHPDQKLDALTYLTIYLISYKHILVFAISLHYGNTESRQSLGKK